MIPITERVGRSPFYERPAHATKREAENERKRRAKKPTATFRPAELYRRWKGER